METILLPLDGDNARVALADACAQVGIDAAGAELIRLGDNAVFRLRSCPVVARVGRGLSYLPAARREVVVARWLAAAGVPAVRALDVAQPVAAAGRVVTLWHSASDREEYGSAADLGSLLRRLHALTAPADLDLHPLAPFERAQLRLDQVAAFSEDDGAFLRERCEDLAGAYAGLVFELPFGVIHGDANVGNVIRDQHGQALLSDLDGFAYGPREWDLVLTAIYYERFGWHTAQEYRAFVDAYGYDVMTWSGYPVLRDVRELLMVTWLAQNAGKDQDVAAELAKRIRALRTGVSRRDWKPF